jgi:hypothetical protein
MDPSEESTIDLHPLHHPEDDIDQLFSQCSLDSERRPGPLAFLPRLKRPSSLHSESILSNLREVARTREHLKYLVRRQARKLLQIQSKDEVEETVSKWYVQRQGTLDTQSIITNCLLHS